MTRLEEIKKGIKKIIHVSASAPLEPGVFCSASVDQILFKDVPYLIKELERAREIIRTVCKNMDDYLKNDDVVEDLSGVRLYKIRDGDNKTSVLEKLRKFDEALMPDECISDLE